MSKVRKITVDCPTCGKQFDTTLWDSLNADLDPAEKKKLISGKFFFATCTHCGKEHPMSYPVLYHDMTNKVMIQLALSEEEAEDFIEAIDIRDEQENWESLAAKGYRYRCVKSVNELQEKALLFDSGLDDRVMELLKLMYLAMIHEKKPEAVVTDMFYFREPTHGIVVFVDGNPSFDFEMTMETYDRLAEGEMAKIEEKSAGCYIIDQEWARTLLR